jgi:N-hydroxyarylamine O-acetyltransferase
MEISAYLDRIGHRGSPARGTGVLAALHRAHLEAVPFENLDIILGRFILLSSTALYEKIVRRRRGGFCFELNGLFGELLRVLGYPVTLLAARVFEGSVPGEDLAHALLLVEDGGRWIADVGFGDSFLAPLRLERGREETQQGSRYRLAGEGSAWVLERMRPGAAWEPQYAFALTPRRLSDFDAMCRHLSTSPESHFTQKSICSRATSEGRVTLSGNRLIVTAQGRREERVLLGDEELRSVLRSEFGITLGPEASLRRLLEPGPPARRD